MAGEFSLKHDWEFVPRVGAVSPSLNLQNVTDCKLLLRIHTDKFIKSDGIDSCWAIDEDNSLTTQLTLDEIYQIIDVTLIRMDLISFYRYILEFRIKLYMNRIQQTSA